MFQNRTHNCNELRMEHVGERVRLVGWMENVREVGQNFAFVVLRDFYGTTQIVIETEDMMKVVKPLNKESTIAVEGVVRERASKNPKLPTGDVEIVPEKIEVLGKCLYNELPFEINRSREADEANRLKYRYLDLRNPVVKQNIILRCSVVAALRQAMMDHGFLEITTPILTASSPEGARDYLVPARKHPGKFYALPQAPQQFKQLLMTAGFDRYFQIAPCFRDEDARGDRSPGEFYQLDMEMAFADQDDVFAVLEDVLPPIFAKYGKYDIASEAPFRRIPFNEAMERYGSDKPDLRIDLEVQDMTALVEGSEFAPFQNGAVVKAIVVTDCSLARKAVDKLCADVEVQAGQKPYWFKVDEQGSFAGGISKFLADKHDEVTAALGLKPGCFVGVTAGKKVAAQNGSLQMSLVEEQLPEDITIEPISTLNDGILSLINDKIDCMACAGDTALQYVKNYPDKLAIAAFKFEYTSKGNSALIMKGHDVLLAAINEAIQAAVKEGKLPVWREEAVALAESLGIENN